MRDTFLIQELEIRSGDAPHTIITFNHPGGRLRSAPFWPSDQHRIEHLRRGQAVEISGTIGFWKDRRQLNVQSIRPLPPDKCSFDLLLPNIGDPAPWWRLIDHWCSMIRGPRLRATLGLLFGDSAFRSQFERCPASLNGHHAKVGGLLQHSCEVAHLALAAGKIIPQADRDLLLAGSLLHDVGKVESYRWDGFFEFTVPGRVIGHVVLGARLLDRAVAATEPGRCNADELDLLQHLILSHHGKLEFGSPMVPMTLEAEILTQSDLTSARADSFSSALKDDSLFPDSAPFSVHSVWQLENRRVWRYRSDWG